MLVMNSLTKQEKSHLNQQALQAARDYSQKVAWPTVILAIVVFVGYWALPLLVIFNNLSLLIAIPLMAVLTYASYTVLHEAVHYCISGNIKSLRWLNDAMGYLAATVLLTPLIAHRCEHLKHHRNANDGSNDPDQYSAEIVTSVKLMLKSCWIGIAGQFTTYMADRWDNAPVSQNRILIIEVLIAIAMRVLPFALLFAYGDADSQGRWVEALMALLLGSFAGTFALLYLFAYIVHRPHTVTERYLNTSTILVPGRLSHLLTVLWGFQNYHAIHHLFPWVPFYQYRRLFDRIRPTMNAMGAPIYRLTWQGLRPVAPSEE